MTYIIVDFEATCCDQNSFPREEMEIIEIGAVALRGKSSEIVDEFQGFVRPVRNGQLTPFCRELTSITQDDVDGAHTFPEVIAAFRRWLDQFENPLFCSWGNYDKKQLHQDCNFHAVSYPFNGPHINIKEQFAKYHNLRRGVGLGRALRIADISFIGTAHRGIDDARNMARLAEYCF